MSLFIWIGAQLSLPCYLGFLDLGSPSHELLNDSTQQACGLEFAPFPMHTCPSANGAENRATNKLKPHLNPKLEVLFNNWAAIV